MTNSSNPKAARAYVVVYGDVGVGNSTERSHFDDRHRSWWDSQFGSRAKWLLPNATQIFNMGDTEADSSDMPVPDQGPVFSALYNTLDEMRVLPEGFGEAIDIATAVDAEKVLGYVEASGVPAPKIFSHGGDAVVFTWDIDKLRRYLTISGGDAAFLDVNKITHVQCPYEIVPLDGPDTSRWLKLLGYSKVAE